MFYYTKFQNDSLPFSRHLMEGRGTRRVFSDLCLTPREAAQTHRSWSVLSSMEQ